MIIAKEPIFVVEVYSGGFGTGRISSLKISVPFSLNSHH